MFTTWTSIKPIMKQKTSHVPIQLFTRLSSIFPHQSSSINRWGGSVVCENPQRNQAASLITTAKKRALPQGLYRSLNSSQSANKPVLRKMTHHKVICSWVVRSEVFRATSTQSPHRNAGENREAGVNQAEETFGAHTDTAASETE